MSEDVPCENPDPQAEFDRWVRDIRDPARRSSEGLRSVDAGDGKAVAEYEIAQLPAGNFAVRFSCIYHCGNGSGRCVPWTEFDSREQCLDFFLQSARHHFRAECLDSNCNDIQRNARREMLHLLNGGLFGFVEPEPQSTRGD